MQNPLRTVFRVVGYLEALSFIGLVGIAMPMKYIYGDLHATRIPGGIHGGLFILYVILAYNLADREKWPQKELWMAYAASVLPFGTLVFDYKFLRHRHQ